MNAHDHAFPPLARAGALLKLTTALLLGKEATKSHKRLFKCKLITMTNSVPLLHWPHTLRTTPVLAWSSGQCWRRGRRRGREEVAFLKHLSPPDRRSPLTKAGWGRGCWGRSRRLALAQGQKERPVVYLSAGAGPPQCSRTWGRMAGGAERAE